MCVSALGQEVLHMTCAGRQGMMWVRRRGGGRCVLVGWFARVYRVSSAAADVSTPCVQS
jgi:hypothetical protein